MSKKIDGVVLPATIGETLISFVCTCVFGLLGLPALFELKDLIPLLLLAIFPLKYAMQAYTIFTILALGAIWLALFFLLWHKLEKSETNKQRVLRTLRWSAIIVGVFLLSIGGHALFDVLIVS